MRIKKRPAAGRKPATLCWYCEKATGGCRWSRFFQPVKGWKALPTVIRHSQIEKGMKSYLVLDCPEFLADMREEEDNRILRQRFISRGLYETPEPGKKTPEQRCGTCRNMRRREGICTLGAQRTKRNIYHWCYAWEAAACRKNGRVSR